MRDHLAAMGFMHFLSELGQQRPVGARPGSKGDVVVPLTRVTTVFEAEQLSHLLWANAARWDAQVLEALTEGLWELVANGLEHSGAPALLMGQVYLRGEPPDHHQRVQIAIGDAGRGIRASFLERRALIKLLVDDPEHGETHRRITARIKPLAISAHHAEPYRRARGGRVATRPAKFD